MVFKPTVIQRIILVLGAFYVFAVTIDGREIYPLLGSIVVTAFVFFSASKKSSDP